MRWKKISKNSQGILFCVRENCPFEEKSGKIEMI